MGLLNRTLLHAKYLQDLWHICCCFCSLAAAITFVRSPEGSKKVQASFPIFGLSVSLLMQRSQDGMDLATVNNFMK